MEHFLGWLKPIYEMVGTPFPRASFVIVVILGAAISGGLWKLVGRQVERDHQLTSPSAVANGSASTSGSQSPAISGNGNSVTYSDSPTSGKKPESGKGK
jgi:hypothetical protein